MKYLKLLAIIGTVVIGIITSGETNSLQFQEVWFQLKEYSDNINQYSDNINEYSDNINKGSDLEKSEKNQESSTIQSTWEFIKANKWYIIIGVAVGGIAVYAYKYLSSESISSDNTLSVDENVINSQTSLNSINSQTEEYEEIKTVLMGVPRDLTDLSEANMVKFVVPAFVKPEEFTTANVLLNTFRLIMV